MHERASPLHAARKFRLSCIHSVSESRHKVDDFCTIRRGLDLPLYRSLSAFRTSELASIRSLSRQRVGHRANQISARDRFEQRDLGAEMGGYPAIFHDIIHAGKRDDGKTRPFLL